MVLMIYRVRLFSVYRKDRGYLVRWHFLQDKSAQYLPDGQSLNGGLYILLQ